MYPKKFEDWWTLHLTTYFSRCPSEMQKAWVYEGWKARERQHTLGVPMSESRTLTVQLCDGTTRRIPVRFIGSIYVDAYAGVPGVHPMGCTVIKLEDGTELETWSSCEALGVALGTWYTTPVAVADPVVEDAPAPVPEPAPVPGRDRLEAAVSAVHYGCISAEFRSLMANCMDTKLHYAELVEVAQRLVSDTCIQVDGACNCVERLAAVLSKIKGSAVAKKADPVAKAADAPVGDDGLHRRFEGSPFSRMLRAVRALQEEPGREKNRCWIPDNLVRGDGTVSTSQEIRSAITKHLDAALDYCAMSDLQHELYGVLRDVNIELAQSDFGFGSASWGKLRKQVSDAMSKVECSKSV